MSKKRIVHIIPTFELGGVQTGILYSLEDLNKTYDYTIFVIGKVDRQWLKNLSPAMQRKIISAGSSSVISGLWKSYKMLKALQPDIIISSLWKSVSLSAIYKFFNKKALLCGFFHNVASPHFLSTFFFKVMARSLDFAFADSHATKNFIQNFLGLKKVFVIPYFFSFVKKEQEKIWNPSSIRFAYFGRIGNVKGMDRALDFCAVCKKKGIPFNFDVYGTGDNEIYAEKIIQKELQDKVTLKGTIPLNKVIETMQQYDFLLHLSYREGMGLSVVEAMNCGLVPIVAPVGEIAQYSKDGENAIWLNDTEDNMELLCDKLQVVLSHPAKYHRLSEAALATFDGYKKYSEAFIESVDKHFQKQRLQPQPVEILVK